MAEIRPEVSSQNLEEKVLFWTDGLLAWFAFWLKRIGQGKWLRVDYPSQEY